MKIRSGFVSNSSSSSFIVATKTSKPCPTCGRGDGNLLDMIEEACGRGRGYEETELKTRGSEETWGWVKENFGLKNGDEFQNEWSLIKEKMAEAENKGYDVGLIEVSYHDEHWGNVIADQFRNKSAHLLWSDHGNSDINDVKL
jgi:hypothetical protein